MSQPYALYFDVGISCDSLLEGYVGRALYIRQKPTSVADTAALI